MASTSDASRTRASSSPEFDHNRTGFPLRGSHAGVSCESCHKPGQSLPEHAHCADCHSDPHSGPATVSREALRCERCHDVTGFHAARFGPEDHARTAYPLSGAHLAVACEACHRRGAASTVGAAVPLQLAARQCADCHRDPHAGQLTAAVTGAVCETCHDVDAWDRLRFDHHSTAASAVDLRRTSEFCAACHSQVGHEAAASRFTGAASTCDSCHSDPHAGQFARAGRGTACDRCHDIGSFKPARFDHARDAAYALDAAHAKLACAACHPTETAGGGRVVRYKPLPSTCAGCHSDRKPAS